MARSKSSFLVVQHKENVLGHHAMRVHVKLFPSPVKHFVVFCELCFVSTFSFGVGTTHVVLQVEASVQLFYKQTPCLWSSYFSTESGGKGRHNACAAGGRANVVHVTVSTFLYSVLLHDELAFSPKLTSFWRCINVYNVRAS